MFQIREKLKGINNINYTMHFPSVWVHVYIFYKYNDILYMQHNMVSYTHVFYYIFCIQDLFLSFLKITCHWRK